MSDFSNLVEAQSGFTSTELDSGVDFSDSYDAVSVFTQTGTENATEFVPTGDLGHMEIVDVGWGDAPWGEGPWGGQQTVMINDTTQWTNIETI